MTIKRPQKWEKGVKTDALGSKSICYTGFLSIQMKVVKSRKNVVKERGQTRRDFDYKKASKVRKMGQLGLKIDKNAKTREEKTIIKH